MNVISYINGDVEITDYPECSDRALTQVVQALNDFVADRATGFLSAEDSVRVLDLAWKTVGTAGKLDAAQREFLLNDHGRRNWEAPWVLGYADKEVAYRLCEETLNLGLLFCGVDESSEIDPVAVDSALEKIAG